MSDPTHNHTIILEHLKSTHISFTPIHVTSTKPKTQQGNNIPWGITMGYLKDRHESVLAPMARKEVTCLFITSGNKNGQWIHKLFAQKKENICLRPTATIRSHITFHGKQGRIHDSISRVRVGRGSIVVGQGQ